MIVLMFTVQTKELHLGMISSIVCMYVPIIIIYLEKYRTYRIKTNTIVIVEAKASTNVCFFNEASLIRQLAFSDLLN